MDQGDPNRQARAEAHQEQIQRERAELEYLCADCGAKNHILPRQPIKCMECGHRIMYKKRTKKSECYLLPEEDELT
ncbi:hypothetical protein CALCODRAFT_426223 [Calocera cornea HHB12733]|uniref:Uncharacterized protein n=1 Tax=Calocera cornea HHB12733 TaxID=1353952 RepID=A0A165JX70_9BASI|nr:hypothetical protein CALCODRAFT_426223 [Calocera cornea HHB12733]